MIGVDTTALIDLFKNEESLIAILEELDEKIFLNNIAYLELMFGLDFDNPKHKREEEYYNNLFNSFPVLPLDSASCKKASMILSELKKKGRIIEMFDCVIAGIYLSKGVNKIITRNKKHFDNMSGIEVLSY